jgi:hypothetical protein
MVAIGIKVINAQIVRQGLQDLAADVPKIGRMQLYRASQNIVRDMKIYPAQPSGSKYVRTYELKNSFKIERLAQGYKIINDAKTRAQRARKARGSKRSHIARAGQMYARYVIGDNLGQGQSQYNTHWRLIRDVTNEEIDRLIPEVSSLIHISAKQKGLTP